MGIFRSRKTSRTNDDESILRAIVESGDIINDPSEDALFMLLEDVAAGKEAFLIVERTADATQQTYAQVAPNDTGGYVVERREGGPDRHFATDVGDVRAAHELITGWAFDLPDRDAQVNWVRQEF